MRPILSVILMISFVQFSQAQIVVDFKILPTGTEYVIKSTKIRYYNLDEWLKLADADSELQMLRSKVSLFKDLNDNLLAQISSFETENKALNMNLSVISDRAIRFDEMRKQCEKDLLSESSSGIIPWILAGIGTVFGIVGSTIAFHK